MQDRVITVESSPAPPPRRLTRRVRLRAWIEPRVRFWWGAGLVLLGIALYLLATRYLTWRQEAELVRAGQVVPATIKAANGMLTPGQGGYADNPVQFQYSWKGQTYSIVAASLPGHREFIKVGDIIPIRIDPGHPEVWTSRLQPVPLALELFGGLIALPVSLVLLLTGSWMAGGVARLWRDGPATQALVISARHTALAPRCWAVQCTPALASDRRVFQVFAPPRVEVTQGATIWLLFRPTSAGRPVAASWFD